MPIGNLTSQIFANIYLNELDRFVKHRLRVRHYLRYGDDFIIIENHPEGLNFIREITIQFLKNELKLSVNSKNDKLIKIHHGLKFLGVRIWPTSRNLSKRNLKRIKQKLNQRNIASYSGIIKQHGNQKQIKRFQWQILDEIIA